MLPFVKTIQITLKIFEFDIVLNILLDSCFIVLSKQNASITIPLSWASMTRRFFVHHASFCNFVLSPTEARRFFDYFLFILNQSFGIKEKKSCDIDHIRKMGDVRQE